MKQFHLGAPWFTIAGFLTFGLLVAVLASWRWGGALIAFGLFVGAAMRAFFPGAYVSDISVRSRQVDIGLYAGLALAVSVALVMVSLT